MPIFISYPEWLKGEYWPVVVPCKCGRHPRHLSWLTFLRIQRDWQRAKLQKG